MKKLILSAIIYILSVATALAADIPYFTGTWAQALAKAKAEHKYIFIDCYTEWCGWCKVMDKETMPDPAVNTLLSSQFIPLKMEMEHGEGAKLAMKYGVSAFPSFLFFSPDGNLIYCSVGYQQTPDFIKTLNNALDKTKQEAMTGYSAALDMPYPEFYTKAFAANGSRVFPKTADVTAWLDKQKNKFDEVSWAVMSRFTLNKKYNDLILANNTKLRNLYGHFAVEDKINNILMSSLEEAIKKKDEKALNTVLAGVDKYITDNKEETKDNYRLYYYKAVKDWNRYTAAYQAILDRDGFKNTDGINSVCWDMYEKCYEHNPLEKATAWMKQIITDKPQYAYLDTYAALLYKTRHLADAETWALKAIETGKKAGETTQSTEDLLKLIRNNKPNNLLYKD